MAKPKVNWMHVTITFVIALLIGCVLTYIFLPREEEEGIQWNEKSGWADFKLTYDMDGFRWDDMTLICDKAVSLTAEQRWGSRCHIKTMAFHYGVYPEDPPSAAESWWTSVECKCYYKV